VLVSGCGYSLGRIVGGFVAIWCGVLGVSFIWLGVSCLHSGELGQGVVMPLIGGLALLPLLWFVPKRKPPEEMPPRLDLSGRVRELALDPQRRSEAVQAYRAETGVSDKDAEKAIADWLSDPSRR
jgi:hypothetical protein